MSAMRQEGLTALPDKHVVLVDESETTTLGDIRSLAGNLETFFAGRLVVLKASRARKYLALYLATVLAKVPVMILENETTSDFLEQVIRTFRPAGVFGFGMSFSGYQATSILPGVETLVAREMPKAPHPDLAVLLGTSGSTGLPKFVRLSRKALFHNATAISGRLPIRETDVAITSLPYSYSYGLSIVNTHFIRGARIVASESSLTSKDFWSQVKRFDVTSLGGVPTSYRTLQQLRWKPTNYPSLRYMTQAGGRLTDDERRYFLDLLGSCGIDFFVMYGQTEATARITIAPPKLLHEKIGAAGRALEGGELSIKDPDSLGCGEVVYRGPNVMMGYATEKSDLSDGDLLNGELLTGDIGSLEDGVLILHGRAKRIVKIFGKRFSLDEIENWLAQFGTCVVVAQDDAVAVAVGSSTVPENFQKNLAAHLGVHSAGVRVLAVPALPQLPNGKTDYQEVQKVLDAHFEVGWKT